MISAFLKFRKQNRKKLHSRGYIKKLHNHSYIGHEEVHFFLCISLLFKKFIFVEVTLIYNIMFIILIYNIMCTTLYFHFYMHISHHVLTTKSLFSIRWPTPFTHLPTPSSLPSDNHYSVLRMYIFVCLVCSLVFACVLVFKYSTRVKSCDRCLYPSDLFYLA